ncbi:MAG: NADPH-dependent 7-cyano-7-deazaguanine reductase QueF [Pseudomonadota bacterium]
MSPDLPLGREVDYPDTYTPELLAPVSRRQAREALALPEPLPFSGRDIWNAWELTWLDECGKPQVAGLELQVPADSPNICESKSLKLYLNSFAMSAFATRDEVLATIKSDLGAVVGSEVDVRCLQPGDEHGVTVSGGHGRCIDSLDVAMDYAVPTEVETDPADSVTETLYSDLFRSLCPVTGQPDYATVQIHYMGPRIREESLLRYLLSFRRHQDFHEACVEQIFMHIAGLTGMTQCLVNARFLRRGGIDINPWRANYPVTIDNNRLWRQ